MNVNDSYTVRTHLSATAKKDAPAASNELGKDAFLKILVTQMKNQNPLEPLKDTEFIGQMAQFSSLEQLTNLNTTMSQFVNGQGGSALSNYADLIGKKVAWEHDGQSGEGMVKAIAMKDGEVIFELQQNGMKMPVTAIQRIA